MKYVPSFKGLKETDHGWELQVSWVITLTLEITRQIGRDEITYLIKKNNGLIKINSYLRFVILPTKDRTVVRLTFFYKGPFERIAKRQTEEFYKRGVEIFKEDLESMGSRPAEEAVVRKSDPNSRLTLLKMKTLLSKIIDRGELDDVLEQAMIWSVNSEVIVIVSDGKGKVELVFDKGDLKTVNGDFNSLNDKLTVLVKGS
ncbi:SRPBCC family protein [Metallosphaera hakonensis JCM 8857 = DSM 7519]|uniref:Polyketide cyclase n=3 Tax=Metallosphaera hakonensis TaxID=79601 RepID=A0A2U9IXC0_9CREN|nr:SRPBCC family protein [Metallosphaera hakonensis JCM 8857 = DSM 7519]